MNDEVVWDKKKLIGLVSMKIASTMSEGPGINPDDGFLNMMPGR